MSEANADRARALAPLVARWFPFMGAGVLALAWLVPRAGGFAWQWSPPPGLTPDLTSLRPDAIGLSAAPSATVASAILARPLFAPSRKPPPPPPPVLAAATPPPPPVVDPLDGVKVLGVFRGAAGGVIVEREGKARRLKVGDAIGDWTITAIGPHFFTVKQGLRSRRLDLVKPAPPPAGPPTFVQGGLGRIPSAPVR